jgi:ankyrin repeat protein
MGSAKPKNVREFVDAAYSGDSKTVKAMLAAGMPVDARDRGTTSILVAASQGHTRIVQTLLRAGANPNAADADGLSLLVQAIRSESQSVVRALVAAGADVNCAETHEGSLETPLMTAALRGDLALVRLLAEAGASINARSAKGLSALDLARASHLEKVVAYLQSHGAQEKPNRITKRKTQ